MRNIYRVFYMNRFEFNFTNRDKALDYIDNMCQRHNRHWDDYEILDNSDYL